MGCKYEGDHIRNRERIGCYFDSRGVVRVSEAGIGGLAIEASSSPGVSALVYGLLLIFESKNEWVNLNYFVDCRYRR